MDAEQTRPFTLKDAEGETHEYECTRHKGDKGLPLASQIAALLVGPVITSLGPLALGAFGSMTGGGKITKAGMMVAILTDPKVRAGMDFAALSEAAKAAITGLPPETIYRILEYTNRDGKALVNGSTPTQAFNVGYAGNYMELGQAVFEVAKHNGFFPALGTFANAASTALAAMPATPGKPETST